MSSASENGDVGIFTVSLTVLSAKSALAASGALTAENGQSCQNLPFVFFSHPTSFFSSHESSACAKCAFYGLSFLRGKEASPVADESLTAYVLVSFLL